MEKCKICEEQSKFLFEKKVLRKYLAQYFQCKNCGFIQVKNPHWLSEAYKEAISPLDTGLVSRNLKLCLASQKIIKKYFNPHKKFIDYGGGYGLFVRLMRDAGFDFYRQDNYCKNLFAQYFDINDLKNKNEKFELLTAVELFEHLEYPTSEIENMLKLSGSILFSTELQPKDNRDLENWSYITPESGQHISFYTEKSLILFAKKFNLNFYTNKTTLHLFTKKTIRDPFKSSRLNLISKIRAIISHFLQLSREKSGTMVSLIQKDYESIKNELGK